MREAPFDSDDDEPAEGMDAELVIDYEDDPVDIRDEMEPDDVEASDDYWDDGARRIDNADLDNVVDEFVDLVNGRDLDGMAELLASDVVFELVGGTSRDDVIDGLNDLFLRYPTLLTTRADLGSEPMVAVWTFDDEADRFDQFGFFVFEMSDSSEGMIQRVSYAEELDDSEDLVVETPDRSDLPEWEEWSELDED